MTRLPQNEPIAVIGFSNRFPGSSSSPSKLWSLLENPRDVLRKLDRFNTAGFYHPDGHHHGATNVTDSYLLAEDHRVFDPQFFNIKPVEADSIDPVQRNILETVYESLEHAGLTIEQLRGSNTAFYAGVMTVDFQDLMLRDVDHIPQYFATGTSRAIISNRVSYFFDWHGPSMTIDTACSSSMIALHQAVQAIRNGESKVALAAGANLILGPEIYIAESKLNMLSPTGRSRMWDADADGYARGEGFASVVMKKLSDAIHDGDYIQCVIRETGTNQDGRSKGLTVPSAAAQTALIRQVYARAGLDLSKREDRPQFFEAHGTGTKAGDPVEAEAIYDAFYGDDLGYSPAPKERLWVGGIKTVIGHLEGTAGLAGVIKVILALRNQTIPPNLLFNRLNPGIEPFYKRLQIPTARQPWPGIKQQGIRRASVNSFGFGGSNAHAIVESFEYPQTEEPRQAVLSAEGMIIPLVFSAASEKSLVAYLTEFSAYLTANSNINIRDLAWTLFSRRSALPVKASFSAATVEELRHEINSRLEVLKQDPKATVGTRTSRSTPHILGIFTGQGAQWATMGRSLLTLEIARQKFSMLEESLQTLPKGDRPDWTISEELTKDSKTSRVGIAEISQPLCTAVQVVLVDILRLAKVKFASVVGHSSGEITCAYAAGLISARDAIRIAYYRGIHAKFARGANGEKGLMMAGGTSLDDARDLCDLPDFENKLKVAASNSPASVTLSGDADAVMHAKLVFEDEKKFARLLKVDTAYHSTHMVPCSNPYIASIKSCKVRVLEPSSDAPIWFSSVRDGARMSAHDLDLADSYWSDNMVNTVLFSQAIEAAIRGVDQQYTLGLEVGPHPALKGPVTQTFQELVKADLPYTGVLSRGVEDTIALSNCLGYIWRELGHTAVDFKDMNASRAAATNIVQGLPSYAWDHSQIYWHESRISKRFLNRSHQRNELLGHRHDDGIEGEMRWRHFLSVKEAPWLSGHQVQGQTVFPGAGYVSMAVEAALSIAGGRSIRVLELQNLSVRKAIAFNDDDAMVETLVTLKNVRELALSLEADFITHASSDQEEMTERASGSLTIEFGEPDASLFPLRPRSPENVVDLDAERFYSELATVGYGWTGAFKALTDIRRTPDFATGSIRTPDHSNGVNPLLIHPAFLDTSFQAVIAAWAYPGDGRLWALHLPTSIKRLRIDPQQCLLMAKEQALCPFNAYIYDSPANEIRGDVDIYSPVGGSRAMLQVEGLGLIAISSASAAEDRKFFSEPIWMVGNPDGELAVGEERATKDEVDLALACERVALFYWRRLSNAISKDERLGLEIHIQRLFNTVEHTLFLVERGQHAHAKKEWLNDTPELIYDIIERHISSIDIKLMKAVGEHLESVARRESTMIEHMRPDNMLEDFYAHGLAFEAYNRYLARMVGQVAHRYPHMKILEVGAGSGGATLGILENIGTAFSSYTYTDISAGFFERAKEIFHKQANRMIFKTLDIEKDAASQGFELGSYDMIVASNVLHATTSLQHTLTNVRALLKPGGYLFLLEVTDNNQMRCSFTMGGLAGWWLGFEDGRVYSPCISPVRWNNLLRQTGFSGVDAITPARDVLPHPYSIIAAQATDDTIQLLRKPVQRAPATSSKLVMLGGQTLVTSLLVYDLTTDLERNFAAIEIYDSLESYLTSSDACSRDTVLNLLDLDEPIFKHYTAEKMEGLKKLFTQSRNIVWVTFGGSGEEPLANASVGLCRSVASELPEIRLQLLDVDSPSSLDASRVAEILMRHHEVDSCESNGRLNDSVLWSSEPELRLTAQGKLLVQRVKQNSVQNDRLNCIRRSITYDVDPRETALEVVLSRDKKYTLQMAQTRVSKNQVDEQRTVAVSIKFSTAFALKVSSALSLYLFVGNKVEGDRPVLGFSDTLASVVAVPLAWTVPLLEDSLSAATLTSVVAAYISKTIFDLAPSHGTTLVHEADGVVADALEQEASQRGRILTLTMSSDSSLTAGPHRVLLHERAPHREIARAISAGTVSLYINASHSTGRHPDLGSRIATVCKNPCVVGDIASLFDPQSVVMETSESFNIVADFLTTAINSLENCSTSLLANGVALTASNFQHGVAISDITPLSCVDWTSSMKVPVKVHSIDATGLFSRRKSYLLLGLTGEIGLALARWMSMNGAGVVVLTSRNPKVSQDSVRTIEAFGAKVIIRSLDTSDKSGLERLVDEVSTTLLPVGGVANGSMVLHDNFFMNMTHREMVEALKPKVDGSRFLDEVFEGTELDFFIMYSSLSSIIGNRGQSNYAAACTYMSGLAHQRRKRGLAGSVMHIGRVVGLGYLERVKQVVGEQLDKYGFMTISEVDLQTMFAEAIVAGRPNSDANPDIITALRPVANDEEVQVPWFSNPRFSHSIIESDSSVEGKKDGKQVTASVKALLADIKTTSEGSEVLQSCFSRKLQVILQMNSESIDRKTPLVELGVDSLVAVEIRTWFLKEVQADVAVLKILNGSSIADICSHVIEKIPETIMPKLHGSESAGEVVSKIPGEPKLKTIRAPVPKPESKPETKSQQAIATRDTAPAPLPAPEPVEIPKSNPDEPRKTRDLRKPLEDLPDIPQLRSNQPTSLDKRLSSIREIQRLASYESISSAITAETLTSDGLDSSMEILSSSSEPDPSLGSDYEKDFPDVPDTSTQPSVEIIRSEKVSLAQKRFWFLNLYMQDRTTSNVTFYFEVSGHIRVPDLERAVRIVAQKHESLRTCIYQHPEDNDTIMQGILSSSHLYLEHKSIPDKSAIEQEYKQLCCYKYELAVGDTMKIKLLSLSPKHHFLLFGYHHMNMDGVSFQILLSELAKAYDGIPLGSESMQYPEFAAKQMLAIEKGVLRDDIEFWKKEYADKPAVLPLLPQAIVATREPLRTYKYNQVQTRLSQSLTNAIKSCSRANASTTFHFYLTVFKTLLCRLARTEEVVVGIADANRNDPAVLNTIGLFLNLIPLRLKYSGSQTFADAVKIARNKIYSSLAHSSLPFDLLLDEVHVARASTHSPLFQAFFDYRQGAQEKIRFGDCSFEVQDASLGLAAYDISLDLTESPEGALIILKTQSCLYDETATEEILSSYIALVESFARNPQTLLEDGTLFRQDSIQQALKLGKGPVMESTWPETLIHRIDEMIQQYPNETAVEDGADNRLTYTGLSARSNTISQQLLAAGVEHGSVVAVFQHPTTDWICSMIAIMRIGGIYVPLDARSPSSRLEAICKVGEPFCVIVDEDTALITPELKLASGVSVLNVSTVQSVNQVEIVNRATSTSTAAILFTSGSTGSPKGIVLRHSGLRNEMEGYTKTYEIYRPRVLQQSAYSFDFSFDQIFTALTTGGSLYIVPRALRGDSAALSAIIVVQGITYTKATPSEYSSWIENGVDDLRKAKNWTLAFGGGESLTQALTTLFATLKLPRLQLFNSYGPAESSISATKIEIEYSHVFEGRIPVGRPLPNYSLYILDEKQRPLPSGIPGEIYIAGPGVASGYMKDETLTNAKFLIDKFVNPNVTEGGSQNYMYKTGDSGRLREDGALLFDGRIDGDTQIKIRGMRIELEDIEHSIVQTAAGHLSCAIVSLRGTPETGHFLVAHVVFAATSTIVEGKREEFLQNLLKILPLPQYMRPTTVLALDEMPLNSHSKTDRLAISSLSLPPYEPTTQSDQNMSQTEQALTTVWRRVLPADLLSLRPITAKTDFFYVGGNSLLLVKLQALIRKEFDVTLPLLDLFDSSTIETLASRIDSAPKTSSIDWKRETRIPPAQTVVGPLQKSTSGREVLLTGATGTLGSVILKELVKNPNITKVHCVAVRTTEDFKSETTDRLSVKSDKVVGYRGDLGQEKLGLTSKTFDMLSKSVDTIVHCGARRSFWDHYQQLRAVNVNATLELTKLASGRRVPFHYISSSEVLRYNAQQPPPADGSNGYVASKWASESILRKCANSGAIGPLTIHRFTPTNKAGDPAQRNMVLKKFQELATSIRTLPALASWEGEFGLLPTAAAVQRLCDEVKAERGEPLLVVEHECKVKITAQEMRDCFDNLSDAWKEDWKTLHPLKWIGQIKKQGFDWIFATHAVSMREGDKELIHRR